MKHLRCVPVVAVVAALGLGGCTMTSRSLGLDQQAPDEFNIVSRAPLQMPPSLDTLPVPQPGENRPQELQPEQQAQVALLGHTVTSPGSLTPGEKVLLADADTQKNLPDIRAVINREHRKLMQNMSISEELAFWRKPTDPTAVIIDPAKEEARLQSNAALGLPLNAGSFDSTILVPKQKALLEGIF